MLSRPCWSNISWEYCLDNISQIRLRQHCTIKLLVQSWPSAHRYNFAGKPAVLNICGSLFFNRVQYHRTILALFVQCWLRSSFRACGTTMNRGRHWLEHFNSFKKKIMDFDCYEEYLTSIYLKKYYYSSVKISKLLFSWYLQINEKSIIPKKKIKEKNWFKLHFNKKECSAHYRILFIPKSITFSWP